MKHKLSRNRKIGKTCPLVYKTAASRDTISCGSARIGYLAHDMQFYG